MYEILPYTYKRAKEFGVTVFPSDKKTKKIDVYDSDGIFIVSVGAKGYKDYPTYLEEEGKAYADKRRVLYKKRHNKYRKIEGSPSYFADNLLW